MISLVTGGAGFIGSHLTRRLLSTHNVVVVDNLSGGWKDNVPDAAQFVEMDLVTGDVDDLIATWQPDVIWHLAAYAAEGLSHWVREHNVLNNWLASTRLINAAVKHGVPKMVYTSSMAVYGSQSPPFTEVMVPAPEDPYGIAKFAVEQDLAAARAVFGLDYTIFRPHNVYGRHQNVGDKYRNVIGIFMRQAFLGEPLTVFGDGSQTRAFSHVSDIVRPMVGSLLRDCPGETFNIGGEQVLSILEVAEKVQALFPGSSIRHVPERYEVKHAFCDHSKARELLEFAPTTAFDFGLARMADWVKSAGVRWTTTPDIEIETGLPVFWQ
jgi:UDP-glucose 4-epimerase